MLKKMLLLFGLLAFVTGLGISKDAKSVVDDVAKTIGAADVNSLQYSASGIYSQFGQNPSPYLPYPRFYAKVTRVLDFQKGLSREEMVRSQYENPPHGGGGQPLYRDASGVTVSSVNGAWGPGQTALTPQGWVKAAMASTPALKSATVNGKPGSIVSFTVNGKYKVEGYVDSENLLTKVNTWMPNPILGDTLIETTYSGYKDFGGIKFPTKIGQAQGGFPTLDLTVSEVQPNAPVPEIRVPGPPQPAKVESAKIADGVWYLAARRIPTVRSWSSGYFIVTIESSVTEGRALANIAEAKRLVPNKTDPLPRQQPPPLGPCRGIARQCREGATIITYEGNKKFYEDTVLKAPHTLEPDMLSLHPTPAKFIWVKDKYVITDGDRTLEIYYVPGAGHTDNLLMSYLPKEKILFITDIFNQFGEPRPNDPPPGIVSPYYAALGENIKRLHLDVQQLAPSHGKGVVSVDLLNKALEGKVQAPPVNPPSGN